MPATPIDETDLYERAKAALSAAAPGSELGPIVRLQGGTSSITYWATYTDPALPGVEKVVIKVAPAGLAPTRNRDVLRQARLQQALQSTGVPAPRVLAEHEGAPPEIPPFFVMVFEDGDCIEPNSLPADGRLPAEEVRARELEVARIGGVLHSIDVEALGLGDEPTSTVQDEVERWTKSFEACDEDLREGFEEVRDLLLANVPATEKTTLIHGDFRLGNTLSRGTEVISVIDWEIWARSDPRIDLGWFFMMCNPDPELNRPISDGMPSTDELVAAYEAARGTKLTGMDYFNALVRYKQAAIMALLSRNARRRGETPAVGTPAVLLRSAKRLLENG